MNHKSILRFATLFALTGALCFAQTSQFGIAMQGLATEAQATAKWVCVTILVIAALSAAFGGTNVLRHFSGTFGGIIIALFALSLVTWLSTL